MLNKVVLFKKMKRFIFTVLIFFFSKLSAFNIEEIDQGVFVHFGFQQDSNENNQGDIANIGFIVGKKSIMVIDTGGTPEIGQKLLEKIREKSNLPISHIVITHSHPDHFFGTQAFLLENPKILGHEKLNRSLLQNFNFYKNSQHANIGIQSINDAQLVEANILIKTNETKTIDLGERLVELKAWTSGHTDNDLSVYDKKTKIFWSENVFVERTPSIRASILGWRKNLEEILNMDIKLIVPGHGKVLDKEKALRPMINYFDRIINRLREFHKNNQSLQESINVILQEEKIDPFKVNKEKWVLFNEYHYSNITKAFTELEWE
tara:strand:- start:118 stop:1077 length:960 start_codon:yes stop_codon:yes gene_type:complete